MKTYWEIREQNSTIEEGTKEDALVKAKKFKSVMDIGDTYMSKGFEKNLFDIGGTGGDMEFWDGEGSGGFDKVVKDIIRVFKHAGLTHIFAMKDPAKKPGEYMSVWIDGIRLKGAHDKIMLAFETWYQRPGYNADPDEIYSIEMGMLYHLTQGRDKPSKNGNNDISKFGVEKLAPADKLTWSWDSGKGKSRLAIIKV
jgi:hypothetical protein